MKPTFTFSFPKFSLALSFLLISLLSVGQTFNPFAPARNFEMFIEQNMVTYGKETKTNYAVGGNHTMANGSSYKAGSNGQGDYIVPGETEKTVAWIGGQLIGGIGNNNFIKVEHGSYKIGTLSPGYTCDESGNTLEIRRGSEKVATSNNNETCARVSTMGDLNVPAAFTLMRDYSQCLATQMGNVTIDAAGFIDVIHPVSFITMTTADLNQDRKITTNARPGHVLVINVVGDGTPWHITQKLNTHSDPQYSMWNLINIPSIHFDQLGSNLKFSILGPNTDVYLDVKEMHGQIVFKNLNQTDKHYQHPTRFLGEVNCQSTGSIGDFVWDDQTNPSVPPNGKQEPFEQGIAGVTVKLYDAVTNTVVATTVTTGGGTYSFTNIPVPAGGRTFYVEFVKPAGYDFTIQNAGGTTPANNSDANPVTGRTPTFTLLPGQHRDDIDAGLICNICIPTPVFLGQLNGSHINNMNHLSWSTFTEVNISRFEIERSSDGITFSRIGTVSPAGTGAGKINYSYVDRAPNTGVNYYRVKVLDKSAPGYIYSNIIQINTKVKGITINAVSPNPFTDQLKVTVSTETSENISVKVLDNSGRVIKSQQSVSRPGINDITISSLGNLAAGVYIVEVKSGNEVSRVKLLKNSQY